MAGYFGAGQMPSTPQEMYEKYKALDIFAVIFEIDAETASGQPYVGNDYIASIVQKYPDQFIGFASVDPWKGKLAIQELERSVKELEFSVHAGTDDTAPMDARHLPGLLGRKDWISSRLFQQLEPVVSVPRMVSQSVRTLSHS